MKKYLLLLVAISFLVFTGCTPNLVPQEATIAFTEKTVAITIKNIGNKAAGEQLTYIEFNRVGVPDAAKPESQYSVTVPGIAAGGSWSSGPIPFRYFSFPRGLDLNTLNSLTTVNLVVRVDAKDMVKESNETDNLYDANQSAP
jgi:hypothetical protein